MCACLGDVKAPLDHYTTLPQPTADTRRRTAGTCAGRSQQPQPPAAQCPDFAATRARQDCLRMRCARFGRRRPHWMTGAAHAQTYAPTLALQTTVPRAARPRVPPQRCQKPNRTPLIYKQRKRRVGAELDHTTPLRTYRHTTLQNYMPAHPHSHASNGSALRLQKACPRVMTLVCNKLP